MSDQTPDGWETVRLGQILRIKHGWAFKGEHFAEEGELVLLTPGHFRPGGGMKLRDKEKYYTASFPPEYLLNQEDLLVALTDLKQDAPILGCPAIVPTDGRYLHNQRLGLVTDVDESQVDRRYLYYLFCADATRAQIRASATGATVRHTAPERIYKVQVPLPSLPEQQRVGELLGSLDRLIEVNNQRMTALEAAAMTLYTEWFVKFRHPNEVQDFTYQSETPFGEIPLGWRVGSASGDAPIRLAKPKIPPYEGKKRYLATADCSAFQQLDLGTALSFADLPSRAQHAPVPDSVWFGRMAGYTKVMAFPDGTPDAGHIVLSSGFACVQPEAGWFSYTLASVLDPRFEGRKSSYATGATQVSLTDKGAKSMPWLFPPADLVERFEMQARPMFELSLRLRAVNSRLVETRDLLIRRLLSGEVRLPTPSSRAETLEVVA